MSSCYCCEVVEYILGRVGLRGHGRRSGGVRVRCVFVNKLTTYGHRANTKSIRLQVPMSALSTYGY